MDIKYIVSKVFQKIQLPTIKESDIDKTSYIGEKALIYRTTVKRYSYVGANSCVLDTDVGAFVSISSDCEIGMGSHPSQYVSTSPVFYQKKNCLGTIFFEHPYEEFSKTIIGNDVWIGSGVRIKSGIKIGDGAIIGAGAVVTSDIEPYAIVGGVPARLIRFRFDNELIRELQKTNWWCWNDKTLREMAPYFDDPQKLVDRVKEMKR